MYISVNGCLSLNGPLIKWELVQGVTLPYPMTDWTPGWCLSVHLEVLGCVSSFSKIKSPTSSLFISVKGLGSEQFASAIYTPRVQ